MQFLTLFLVILLCLTSLFLVCLVLIQRGKGGGLAGAFGGQGGSSAFGSKAGDVFTRVTMIAAAFWIGLNMLLVVISNNRASAWSNEPGTSKKASTGTGTVGDLPAKDDAKGSDAPSPAGKSTSGLPDPLAPLTNPTPGDLPGSPGTPSSPGIPLSGPKP